MKETVQSNNVKAAYKNGVPTVTLPKSEEAEGKKLKFKIDA